MTHHMTQRAYLIDGQHRATLTGWRNGTTWEPDTTTPPECKTCALSAATVRALYLMASLDGQRWTVDGQTIEAL